MKRFFDWLFGRRSYNCDLNGKSSIFYLAPRSIWRRVKDVRDISVSTFAIGDENKEKVTGRNLGELFFYSLPRESPLLMTEVAEKTIILRIDRAVYPENPGKIFFTFFYISWGDLHPGEYAPGKKIS